MSAVNQNEVVRVRLLFLAFSSVLLTAARSDPHIGYRALATGNSQLCSEQGVFRHPLDCRRFVRCVTDSGSTQSFIVFEGTCDPGLVFDENSGDCISPEFSDPCNVLPEDEPLLPSSTSSESRRQPNDLQVPLLVKEAAAAAYSSPKPSESTNRTTDILGLPPINKELVQVIRIPNIGSASVEDEDELTHHASHEDLLNEALLCDKSGFYRNPSNCSQYYECVEIKAGTEFIVHPFECRKGLIFDVKTMLCVEPTSEETASCQSSHRSKRAAFGGALPCRSEGFFRHPQNCRAFYRCAEVRSGVYSTHLFSCPNTLVFDEKAETCNWPHKAAPCSGGPTRVRTPTQRPVPSRKVSYGQRKVATTTTKRPPRGPERRRPTAQQQRKPSQVANGCRATGFFANPEACGKYYRCVKTPSGSFQRYDYTCPRNRVYDSRRSECSRSYTCYSSRQSQRHQLKDESAAGQGESGGSEDTKSQGECTKEGYFRNPQDCSKFYRCVDFTGDGKSFTRYDFSCPEDLVFDEESSVCNWPEKSSPCETSGGQGSAESGESEGDSGAEKDEEDASKSTTTSKPRTTKRTTARPKPTTSRPKTTADSGKSTEEQSTTASTQSGKEEGDDGDSGQSDGECEKEGYFRDPNDCNKFYRCVDFKGDGESFVKYDFKCPEGLVFDESNSVCNWPEESAPCEAKSGQQEGQKEGKTTSGEGKSSSEEESGYETSTTSQAATDSMQTESSQPSDQSSTTAAGRPGSTPKGSGSSGGKGECTEEGFFRNPEDCNKFYRCVDFKGDGKEFVRYDFTCPEGLVFDEENDVCNWPEETAPCDGSSGGSDTDTSGEQSSTAQTSSTTESSATKSSTDGSGSDITTASATDSSKTTKATSSTSTDEDGDSTSTSGDEEKSTKGESGDIECTEEGYFRNPDDCSKFYRCVDFKGDGQSYVRYDFECAEGLIFDEVNSVCNWPEQSPPCEARKETDKTTSDTSTTTDKSTAEGKSTESQETTSSTEKTTTSKGTTSSETTSKGTTSSEKRTTTTESPDTGDQTCEEEGFFRDKKDCSKFYRCVKTEEGLERYDFKCPEDLIFDEKNEKCDWPSPENTCEEESSTTGSDSQKTTTASSTTSAEDSCTEEGFFRDKEDCKKYYRCKDEEGDGALVKREYSCEEGEFFDEERRFCNRADPNDPCKPLEPDDSSSTTTTTTQPSSTSTTTETSDGSTTGATDDGSASSTTEGSKDGESKPSDTECTEEGFFRNPDDCNKFYRCVDFKGDGESYTRYDFECPEGLIFDEVNSVCNWPEQSPPCETSSKDKQTTDGETTSGSATDGSTTGKDSSTTDKDSSTTTEGTTAAGDDSCTEEGFFRDKEDCKKYYRCKDEEGDGTLVKREYSCEEGEFFDEERRFCNRADPNDPCKPLEPEDSSSTTTTQPTTTSTTTEASDGSTTEATDDGSTSSTTEGSKDGESKPSDTECTEEGFFRNPDDCSKFYRCVDAKGDGKSYTRYDFECPEGLIFDEVNSVCNWPEQSPPCETSSKDKQTTDGETTSGSATDGSTTGKDSSTTTEGTTAAAGDDSCTEEGFFRDKEDCKKYYRCKDEEGDGTLVKREYSCEEGEFFDEERRFCNRADPNDPCKPLEPDDSSSTTTTTTQPSSTSTTTETSDGSTTGATDDGSASSTTEGSKDGESKPSDTECTEEGFFRNPDDCNKFYRCVDFKGDGESYTRYDFECPEGLIFDEVNSVCNWPEQSPPCETSSKDKQTTDGETTSGSATDGSTTSKDSSTTTEGTTAAGDDSCTEEGFFRDSEDCKKYYRCLDEENDGTLVKREYSCKEGEVFDEERRFCNRADPDDPCKPYDPEGGAESSSTTTSATDSTSSTGKSSTTTTTAGSTDSESSEETADGSGEVDKESGGDSSSSDIECTEEGFFRHPDDCNKFYRCVDFKGDGQSYVRYDFDCPEGLVFDEVNSVCNWPEQTPPCETGSRGKEESSKGPSSSTSSASEATDGTTEATKSDSTSSADGSTDSSGSSSTTKSDKESSKKPESSSKIECTEEGFFRHPDDCNKFYRCVDFKGDGQSYVRYDFDCPEGLVFDEVNSVCNWPEQTPPCEAGGGSSSKEKTKDSADVTTAEEDKEDFGSGEVETTTSMATSTTTGASTSTGGKSSDGTCEEEGFFRNPDDCTRYYKCERDDETGEFSKEDFQCPEDHVFDEEGRYCNAKEFSPPCEDGSNGQDGSKDGGNGKESSEKGSNGQDGGKDFECEEEGFFRDPEDCRAYFQCSKKDDSEEFDKKHYECPEGRIFDEKTRYCNEEELSEEPCDTSSGTSKPGEQDGSSESSGTDSAGSENDGECKEEGFFRNPEDCTRYYQCLKSNDSEDFERRDFQCPEGRVFDEEGRYCNDKELADPCDKSDSSTSSDKKGSDTTPGEELTNEESKPSSSGEGRRSGGGSSGPQCNEEGFFRSPDDCNKFYRCVDFRGDGQSYVRYDFDCPQGLIFDEVNTTCNWPTMTPGCENSR